jgi:hypothetical protein
MRTMCLAILATLAFAACGDDERPASAAPEPDTPVSSGDVEPGTAPALPPAPACKRLGNRLVDEALPAAETRAAERGCTLRIAEIDGEPQALTEDFSPARINVRVRDGVITAIAFMG